MEDCNDLLLKLICSQSLKILGYFSDMQRGSDMSFPSSGLMGKGRRCHHEMHKVPFLMKHQKYGKEKYTQIICSSSHTNCTSVTSLTLVRKSIESSL